MEIDLVELAELHHRGEGHQDEVGIFLLGGVADAADDLQCAIEDQIERRCRRTAPRLETGPPEIVERSDIVARTLGMKGELFVSPRQIGMAG